MTRFGIKVKHLARNLLGEARQECRVFFAMLPSLARFLLKNASKVFRVFLKLGTILAKKRCCKYRNTKGLHQRTPRRRKCLIINDLRKPLLASLVPTLQQNKMRFFENNAWQYKKFCASISL